MNKVYVLGVGPGSPDFILPVIYRKVKECDLLVGGTRNLALFKTECKEELIIGREVEKVIKAIIHLRQTKQIGVLVSGDPGFYSLLATLLRHFKREELEVFPGINSLQYLFARGSLPWQDAYVTSLHGRRTADLGYLVKRHAKIAFLTDAGFSAGEIARFLVEKGIKGKRALVGEDLSYPEERIRDMPLEDLAGLKVSNLCVMVIYDADD